MIIIESGKEVFLESIKRYETHFKTKFPTFEYVEIAKENGVVTMAGAKRFSDFIDIHIDSDIEVHTPEDYEDRYY